VNVQALTALLAALVILAIGASVLLKDRTARTYTSFAAFTFVVAAWHMMNFIAMATESPLARWLALWPAATIPPTALAFFREFIAQPSIGAEHRPPRVTLFWTVGAYLALIYAAIVDPIHTSLWFQIPFGAYVFGGLYRCIYDLYVQYRATVKRVERTRVRYLMVGGFVAITLALTDVLPRFDIAWPSIGNVLSILYLYFLSQSLFRYRLIDVNELLGKMAVLGTLLVMLWAVYGLLLTWVGGDQDGLFLLTALVASFVILILFEPIRTRLENGINRWLVRQRHELRGRLEALRRELINVVDVNDMANRTVAALEESRRVTGASIYLLDSDGAGFDLIGFYGATPVERMDSASHRYFLERLRDGYIDLELIKQSIRDIESGEPGSAENKEELEAVLTQLEEMNAGLVFPMLGSEETEQGAWLLGLLVVRDERAESAFDLDDIDMFRQLSSQAARTIESSQVFERVKERDRLAAIGEMSAGLAHEIRNPLGAIKGAAQLLVGPDGKPVEPSPESAEFLNIIIEEVDRLNNVVSQFLSYARVEKSDPKEHGEIDLNEVVSKTVQLLENSEDCSNRSLEVRLDELLPPVAGDPEQLRQVFLNLGINALQAIGEGGKLEIITTRRRRSRLGYGSFAEVRFRDDGVGIPRDKLEKLFIPFYTTKERGTGLGLAISHRIVSQHGGTIEVRSNPGKGSTFSVFLPALGPSLPSRPKPEPAAEEPAPARAAAASPAPATASPRLTEATESN
jgi:signal transduction histidine kinase